MALPEELKETSGVAFSRTAQGLLWTHSDEGSPVLYALNAQGERLGELLLRGARNRDWEDVASGACGAGSCIYVGDVGDNQEIRQDIVLYRVPDPGVPGPAETASPDAFPLTLPDGPRDIEALFVLPQEEVFFVTKGRSGPVTVYRYPPPLRPGEPVELEEVQALSEDAVLLPSQITGADATPDGRIVVLRT